MDARLTEFTREALSRGSSRDEIRAVLVDAGWPANEVEVALGAFAPVAFPVPVPRPQPSLSARQTFIHLVFFSALLASALAVGHIGFRVIDMLFPDPLNDYAYARSGEIRWSLSSLLVSFPIFLLCFRAIARSLAERPEQRHSAPRRWLTYMALFFAGLVLAGDGTTLVYNLLGGEITIRFLLKSGIVAALAGGIFVYFFRELRHEEGSPARAGESGGR